MAAHAPRPALPRGLGLLGHGRLPWRPAEQAGARADRAAAWSREPASSASSLIIAVTGEPFPGTRAAILALVAGVAGVIALGCFYRALSIGTMSIVAPISATGVTLPVVVGIATGDRLSTVVAAGLAVTVVGVVLASRERHDDARAGGGRQAQRGPRAGRGGRLRLVLRAVRRGRRRLGAVAAGAVADHPRAGAGGLRVGARDAPAARARPRSSSSPRARWTAAPPRSTAWPTRRGRSASSRSSARCIR